MMVSDSKYQGRTTFNVMIVLPSWTKILLHFQKLWHTYTHARARFILLCIQVEIAADASSQRQAEQKNINNGRFFTRQWNSELNQDSGLPKCVLWYSLWNWAWMSLLFL